MGAFNRGQVGRHHLLGEQVLARVPVSVQTSTNSRGQLFASFMNEPHFSSRPASNIRLQRVRAVLDVNCFRPCSDKSSLTLPPHMVRLHLTGAHQHSANCAGVGGEGAWCRADRGILARLACAHIRLAAQAPVPHSQIRVLSVNREHRSSLLSALIRAQA